MPIGIDLHFDAAIAKNSLSDDGHRVDTFIFARHNKGRRLVVGIRCTGANSSDEHVGPCDWVPVPFWLVCEEGYHLATLVSNSLCEYQRIGPN